LFRSYCQRSSSWFSIADTQDASTEKIHDKVINILKESFRPEFLNRIDEIVIFNYLGKNEIKKIVELELRKVDKRLGVKNISLTVTETAKEVLAARGFDANLGARPLRRVIQKLVLDPLAIKIVSGEVQEGDNILVDAQNSEIIIKPPLKKLNFLKLLKLPLNYVS